jgi:hypothetical protein
MWDRNDNHVSFHRVEYPIDTTVNDIARAGLPRDIGLRLEVGR